MRLLTPPEGLWGVSLPQRRRGTPALPEGADQLQDPAAWFGLFRSISGGLAVAVTRHGTGTARALSRGAIRGSAGKRCGAALACVSPRPLGVQGPG